MVAESICLITMLGACAWEDLLWKRIHVLLLLAGAVSGVLLHIAYQRLNILDVVGGFAVGGVLLLVSVASHGRIGIADAMMIMTTGIYLGFLRNLELLWLASLLTGITGAILLFRNRLQGRHHLASRIRIPFAPAVLVVVVLALVVSKGKMV